MLIWFCFVCEVHTYVCGYTSHNTPSYRGRQYQVGTCPPHCHVTHGCHVAHPTVAYPHSSNRSYVWTVYLAQSGRAVNGLTSLQARNISLFVLVLSCFLNLLVNKLCDNLLWILESYTVFADQWRHRLNLCVNGTLQWAVRLLNIYSLTFLEGTLCVNNWW